MSRSEEDIELAIRAMKALFVTARSQNATTEESKLRVAQLSIASHVTIIALNWVLGKDDPLIDRYVGLMKEVIEEEKKLDQLLAGAPPLIQLEEVKRRIDDYADKIASLSKEVEEVKEPAQPASVDEEPGDFTPNNY